MSLIKRTLPNEKNEREFIIFKEKPKEEELNNLTITNIIFNFNWFWLLVIWSNLMSIYYIPACKKRWILG